MRKFCELHPDRILSILKDNITSRYADTLIQLRAQQDPEEVYRYGAAVNTALGKKIQSNNNPLVHTIIFK